jgi:hypothetical protein
MGIVWESRVMGTSAVESCYQAMTGEVTTDWKDLVRAVVNCRVCELAIALWLLVVTTCKCSINPIASQNPIDNHSYMRQYYAE